MKLLKSRKFHAVASLGVVVGMMAACGFEEAQYNFNKKSYKESELEEHLADLLEVENGDLDIEIDIYQESDD
ncbi:hypothetical protein [Cytobacillus horneckiae]|uniref:hypothetical protein n=1 Tax=Cytobacillus horneckiae TaxID=549687 RepID=UPI0020406D67|nr:hypothetical protein [Cytobacillus horneckiae]MCM3179714.1 hypothetical protein [Cytobacillus horneckiae]